MIRFYNENIPFSLKGKARVKRWLKELAVREGRTIGDVNIIFCSDAYLLDINRRFLSHDYYTDIITFDTCEGYTLNGDIFIRVDTVRANADEYAQGRFDEELNRVMAHGVLHLVGYDDHSEEEQQQMRNKENEYLALKEELER